MKNSLRALVVAVSAALLAMTSGTALADTFVAQRAMKLDTALAVAQAVLAACRTQDWQASVGVVDQYGNVRVLLRDELAGPHTATSAVGKAHTALVSATSTRVLAERTQAGRELSGMRFLPRTIHEGGGELIRFRGEIVGAVGVGGAPGPHADVRCAREGLQAVRTRFGLDDDAQE